jgi:hypothetical protein
MGIQMLEHLIAQLAHLACILVFWKNDANTKYPTISPFGKIFG